MPLFPATAGSLAGRNEGGKPIVAAAQEGALLMVNGRIAGTLRA